jgi:hypothetical protein
MKKTLAYAVVFVLGIVASVAGTAYVSASGGQFPPEGQPLTPPPVITAQSLGTIGRVGFGQVTTLRLSASDGETQCMALYEAPGVGATMTKLESSFCH